MGLGGSQTDDGLTDKSWSVKVMDRRNAGKMRDERTRDRGGEADID